MKLHEIRDLFERHFEEHCHFERIEKPPSQRRDLCAFLKLDQICPGDDNIVSSTNHDEIYLGVHLYGWNEADEDIDVLPNLTENDIIYLRRCGVSLDWNTSSLSMFV